MSTEDADAQPPSEELTPALDLEDVTLMAPEEPISATFDSDALMSISKKKELVGIGIPEEDDIPMAPDDPTSATFDSEDGMSISKKKEELADIPPDSEDGLLLAPETEATPGDAPRPNPPPIDHLIDGFRDSIQALPPLTRNNRLISSGPGAYAVGGFLRELGQQRVVPQRQANTTSDNEVRADAPNDDTSELALAEPVDEETNLQVAEAYENDVDSGFPWAGTVLTAKKCACFAIALLVATLVPIFLLREDQNGKGLKKLVPDEEATNQIGFPPTRLSFKDRFIALVPSIEEGTAQERAFQWMLNDALASNYSDVRLRQRYALATIYFSTEGHRWLNNDNWLNYTAHECDWFSTGGKHKSGYMDSNSSVCSNVTHAPDGTRVYKKLWLHQNNLQGKLPEEIRLLQSLTSLSLRLNTNLEDTITPSILRRLTNLEYLAADSTGLSSTLPTEIGLLVNLTYLNLANSAALKGKLPTELGLLTRLRALVLDTNQFTGGLISELGLLSSSLDYFWTASNQMNGTLPTEIARMTNLMEIWVHNNMHTGIVPTEFMTMSNLTELYLHKNKLTGTLHTELGEMSSLAHLLLDTNDFTGMIPTEIGNLRNLLRIWLHRNSLLGSIPSELGQLSQLSELNIYSNQLSGSIPWSDLWNLHDSLKVMQLRDNALLTGVIPSEIGQMTKLVSLWLDGTLLEGPIPSEIGALPELYYLLLGNSLFNGTIPTDFGLMPKLKFLHIQSSRLTGHLPSELGLVSTMLLLNLEENDLSGTIPVQLSGLATDGSLLSLNITGNELLTGTLPGPLCVIGGYDKLCPDAHRRFENWDHCGLAFNCSGVLCGCDCECIR